ncbi:hypothetical protein JCM10207_000336 [Rhodosporidiobolus poonsookiae]
MAGFNAEQLRPAITAILANADRASVSAKFVRKQLQAQYPNLDIKGNKTEIDALTEEIFTADDPSESEEESSEDEKPLAKAPSKSKPKLPSFRKLESPSAELGMPESSPAFPLASVPKGEPDTDGDAEYARQLQQAYDTPGVRSTRNGGVSTKKTKAGGKKQKRAVSKREVSDSDGSDLDDDDKPKKKRKVSNSGFNKLHLLSPELAEVTGKQVLSRPGATKYIWRYIKANDLQDPSKKTDILPDETLSKLFPVKRISSFAMAKYIGAHLSPYDEAEHGDLEHASDYGK